MLLLWGNGGQFAFVSSANSSWSCLARFKKRTAAALMHFSSSIDTIWNKITGSGKTLDLWLHISISDVCLLTCFHTEEETEIIFWCWLQILNPATFTLTWGVLEVSEQKAELWLAESLVDLLRMYPFLLSFYFPLFVSSLFSLPLFLCVLSQSTGPKGQSPGLNMLQPFRFNRPAFGSLENGGMKVNCKFL